VTCNVPNPDNLQGLTITADYNGTGTTLHDVLIATLPFLAVGVGLALVILVSLYFSR
jgi:hypothetical protein